MYQKIKRLLVRFVPRAFLFRYEPIIRMIYAQWHFGWDYACNICKQGLRNFVTLENGDRLCPRCGSIARDRRLWQLLQSGLLQEGMTILDFSPSRCLYRAMKNHPGITYISTDISGDFLSDRQYDITRIDASDATFDLIICYHILEHIEADRQAMRELYRVLKPKGTCLVQTPFQPGAVYEDASIISEADRLIHFGQEDHVRIYSVTGLQRRLEASAFLVNQRTCYAEKGNKHGFPSKETLLMGFKSSH